MNSKKPKKGATPPQRRSRSAANTKKEIGPSRPPANDFCIVGIGASAGGLEALQAFFDQMPSNEGLAFVLVQHLEANRHSLLGEILQRHTEMKVAGIESGMKVKPNHLYIAPPDRYVGLFHHTFQLVDKDTPLGIRLPIDYFFRSLSEEKKEKAICIVLSGAGSDGTLGLRAVKEAGGMTMVQDEKSARYDNMPRSAIATGSVDYILPVETMPQQLLKYIRHPYVLTPVPEETLEAAPPPDYFERVFFILRSQTGHDFTHYKRNTIVRRIQRRMAVHQIDDLKSYVRFLEQRKEEVQTLFKELLIGVTCFFRDPDSFEAFKTKVIPRIFDQKRGDQPIRIWDAGCSTGEEIYSIGILLAEESERRRQELKVQIFATDIDNAALDVARAGLYPESIAADVSAARLKRFFVREGRSFRIQKEIREMVVFAKQDVIKDPPFSRLDFIICRNLLIYFASPLQKRIIPLFHYTLNPGGILMLGPSESIGEFAELFTLLDKKWKIFFKKNIVPMVDLPNIPLIRPMTKPSPKINSKGGRPNNVVQLTEKVLLNSYAPPSVVINERHDIVHIQGKTRPYLELPSGEASFNILKMVRDELRIELRTAIHRASKEGSKVVHPNLRIRENGKTYAFNLVIQPLNADGADGLILVVFDPLKTKAEAEKEPPGAPSKVDRRIVSLENELNSTKESLQTTIEELETSNEELKSTNEEMQSTNEEMQSTNEELETSKEELQSINEELVTVNSELQMKLDELSQSNDDMTNLLASTEVGTLFLDRHLRIKRFTPATTQIMNLIPTDLGRPLSDITGTLMYDDLNRDAEQVLNTLAFKEKELQTRSGEWYRMRALPYRTGENVIEGVIIIFIPITGLKKALQAAEVARQYGAALLNALTEPTLILSRSLQVLDANEAYYQECKASKEETLGQPLFTLAGGQWNRPKLKQAIETVFSDHQSVYNFEVEDEFEKIGRKRLRLSAKKTPPIDGIGTLLILTVRT
ncbi:MAG: PAS domain-containing protein [Nitrospirae bacterium]|nr:PAS domain-containing protein [Candidatus Manganitrophaceae bacterium]